MQDYNKLIIVNLIKIQKAILIPMLKKITNAHVKNKVTGKIRQIKKMRRVSSKVKRYRWTKKK